MSSSKSDEDMAAVRRKVAQLEAKQKIQRIGIKKELIKVQQAMEKRDRETEKKELEAKIEKIELAFQNERRDRLLDDERKERLVEKKEVMATLENERRDRLLGDEKRDRLLADERRDRLLDDERRDRLAEKKEMMAILENERRERQEGMKAETKEMMAILENERRDRLLDDERRERLVEKKGMLATLENERREQLAERKEMMAKLEAHEREHQHQIEQLKSEARISQMEQQLLEVRAYPSQGVPISRPTIQHPGAVDPAPQRETELLLLQRIQQMEIEREQLKATIIQPMAISSEASPAHLQKNLRPDASAKTSTLQSAPHKSAVAPRTPQIVSRQASKISSPQASKPNVPSATSITPSRSTQQQHQVAAALPQGNTKTAQGRPVPLPGDSDNHFFLSHCQSTGGDQTNAIYLELRQLGFACWYDNRADDLTKEGMRQGIVHAAAFLLFLSKGVLDRPFCK
jgi:hypothetical protein